MIAASLTAWLLLAGVLTPLAFATVFCWVYALSHQT